MCHFPGVESDPGGRESFAAEGLTVNARSNPLGIGRENLAFGWAASCRERGMVQEAYQIRLGTGIGNADVWDSGRVESRRQVDVVLPDAVTLGSASRYYWQVQIWNGAGKVSRWSDPAWFETGLLAEKDWAGARWISRPIDSPDPDEWTDYTVAAEFKLHREGLGFFLRVSADGRDGYLYKIDVTGENAVLKPCRIQDGVETPMETGDLARFGFTREGLAARRHTIEFDLAGSAIVAKLDRVVIDSRSDSSFSKGFVGFRTRGAESGEVYRIDVLDNNSGTGLIDREFTGGENGFTGGVVVKGALRVSGETVAVFANRPPSLPRLRGKFEVRDEVISARIYASALGIYELSINGEKAGDQYLAPGWTDYDKRIQSQTYDVTDLVKRGGNVIGAALADGWYRGKVGVNWTQVYGERLAIVAKVRVTYSDGSSEWFSSNLEWKASDGPYVRADLQDGEAYDARREQPGWNTEEFDSSDWLEVEGLPDGFDRLVPQPDEPIRAIDVLSSDRRIEPDPGVFIYDLGQNMVGVPRIRMTGRRGETVTIRHGEELYRTGTLKGRLYTDNLRGALATDSYTFAGDGPVLYEPKFTQHGFRYVEIRGVPTPPSTDEVKGVVLASDLPNTGNLETSVPMINRLVGNIRWGQRGNFLSIPTDTPARDERLGWTGDINVFAPAASRLQDTRAFLSKWMTDVRDAQKSDGNIPAVVPRPGSHFDESGVGWSDAFITVPYAVWKAFGDERILRENWEGMTRFYLFMHDSATRDGDLVDRGRVSFFSGDWLTLEEVDRLEEHQVIATAYFAENTRMMAEMAGALGKRDKAEEYARLYPEIRTAFTDAFCERDGSIHVGTQTVYALALGMDLITDPVKRTLAAERFVKKLSETGFHLSTGFLGTPWLLPALTRIGRDDIAFRILLNETYPSWGFPIKMGATTMWERWNSIGPDGEFGPVSMNSFNHYAYGAVGDWIFGKIGGLTALEPGFRRSRIAPAIGCGGMTFARCTQKTPYGTLASEWNIADEGVFLIVEIPVNTTSEIVFPTADPQAVTEDGVPAVSADGVLSSSFENKRLVLTVGSGTYRFSVSSSDSPTRQSRCQ